MAKVRVYANKMASDTVDAMKAPHQLSPEAIEEFKVAYHDEFGITLSDPEARVAALRLLQFFVLMTTPNMVGEIRLRSPHRSN